MDLPLEKPLMVSDEALIEEGLSILQRAGHPKVKKLQQEVQALRSTPGNEGLYYFILEDMFEALNDVAPEGYYFGDKDNAYGFWQHPRQAHLRRALRHIMADVETKCKDCGEPLELQVCHSNAGYYVGKECSCGPYSRESGYFKTFEQAEQALKDDEY